MSSLFIRADSIITIYDQRNVTPVRNAIRRETNQPDLPSRVREAELNRERPKSTAPQLGLGIGLPLGRC